MEKLIKEARVDAPAEADPVVDLSARVHEYDMAIAGLMTDQANTEALERQLAKAMDKLTESKHKVATARDRVVRAANIVAVRS